MVMEVSMDVSHLTDTKYRSAWKRRFHIKWLVIFGLIIESDKLFKGLLVNGQVTPVEAESSPSHIIAIQGSSVWLHWNYTYGGDGNVGPVTLTFREQIIGFNSTSQPSVQTLAKRTGQNGALTLESFIPAPFAGRVQVISSNSTLVIHNLLYNDSTCQFSSNVKIDSVYSGTTSTYHIALKPAVAITVNGIPVFVSRPQIALDVNEGSNLQLKVEMDGNPQPSADFRWPHLTGSSAINVPSVQLYPFVYTSTYILNNIDASYCGRVLETTLKNSIGSSSDTASTNVTVLLKLDMDFGLKAGKIGGATCVEVKWKKVESGACYVKYEVVLKNVSGSNEYSNSGYNIGKMTMCTFTTFSNVTDVQLTVSFKSASRNVTAKVSDTPLTTQTPTPPESTSPSVSQNTATIWSSPNSGSSGSSTASPEPIPPDSDSNIGLIVGASVGGVIFLIIVIVLIVFYIKKSKRSRADTKSSHETHYPLQESQYAVASDITRKQQQDQTYADPNKPNLIYGKLSDNAADRPRHTGNDEFSDYADVKVDEKGYPAVGAMPTSYTDGYGERSRSRGDSGRENGRRTAPDRRPPPPYSEPDGEGGYPHSTNVPPVYAQVNKPRKHR